MAKDTSECVWLIKWIKNKYPFSYLFEIILGVNGSILITGWTWSGQSQAAGHSV